MAWNIDNVTTHCFYCDEPLDVGGLHGTEAVYFQGRFVCRVFSHSACMTKYEKELKNAED
jgi:hypothetical protein